MIFFYFTIFFSCRYMYVCRQLALVFLVAVYLISFLELTFIGTFGVRPSPATAATECNVCPRFLLLFRLAGRKWLQRAAIRLSRLSRVTVNARKMRLPLQDARYYEIGSLFHWADMSTCSEKLSKNWRKSIFVQRKR